MSNYSVGEANDRVELAGSQRYLPLLTERLDDIPDDEVTRITMVVRRRAELSGEVLYGHHKLSREELLARHFAGPTTAQFWPMSVARTAVVSRSTLNLGA